MARGHEEASTSQAGCKRGTPWETPTVSSLVAAMSVEDLRSFRQVPATIRLEMSDGIATSTMGTTNNAVYFTRAVCCWTLPHCPFFGNAVPTLHWGTSCTCTFECLSDFYGLQCAKLSLLD